MDPNYPLACCWLSVTYLLRGMVAEARHYAEHALSLVSFPQLLDTLAGVARRGGDYRRPSRWWLGSRRETRPDGPSGLRCTI
jgi:hypothetical protein